MEPWTSPSARTVPTPTGITFRYPPAQVRRGIRAVLQDGGCGVKKKAVSDFPTLPQSTGRVKCMFFLWRMACAALGPVKRPI